MKVHEIFYSIQGEGLNVGQPMVFIRLQGCSMGCAFCDTAHSTYKHEDKGMNLSVDQVMNQVKKYPTRWVCITGGEPTEQHLSYLVDELHKDNHRVALETNGSIIETIVMSTMDDDHKERGMVAILQPLSSLFDWISVSPKRHIARVCQAWGMYANEFKFVIRNHLELETVKDLGTLGKTVFLQPVDNDKNVSRDIHRFILDNPRFRLGQQLHKTLEIA